MHFLVDAQLPPALARCLTGHGHDTTHVADHGMASATDEAIWAFAVSVRAAILTKDEDFASRRIRSVDGPSIVWLRFPNMRRRQVVDRIERLLPSIVQALEAGEGLVEVV